ncbi:MAG: UDP-N-acetylmuramoyl-tripeptide--D-alanyl-D-alanine ligase [Patescibacteria group bacterium]|jgi:UDP-N-acetylmuramoyl-tripeptide--D-alanyl-D-alanine ligase
MKYENMKVCLDSRLIKKGEYFIPVKGEETDGHLYINSAIRNGAVGIIEEQWLYDLVREKLSKIRPRIIGVTGSSGKSSVTTFLYQMLETKYRVCLGNLNTKLGLGVNVINDMNNDCEIFIAEMGMDKAGELKETTSLFPPDISVITTINETHAEKLGSVENILNAKTEIVDGTIENGFTVLNYDNQYLKDYGGRSPRKVIWFGLSNEADFNPQNIDISRVNMLGSHNIGNLMACIAICKLIGMNDEEVQRSLERVHLPKGRLNTIEGLNNSTLIDDSYNASPASTKAALDVLATFADRRKVAILGDMLELGQYERDGHEDIGRYTNGKVNFLVCVGERAKMIFEKSEVVNKRWIENSESFGLYVFEPSKDDVVLIKGSQGARMEKITEKLMLHPDQAEELLVRQDARWK